MLKPAATACAIAFALIGVCASAAVTLAAEPENDAANAATLALGEALFKERCATCHGDDATGNGPAAAGLKVAPANLTEISKRAGGTFPAARVVEIITYGGNIAAHGSGPMPVWGRVFSEEGGGGKIGATHSRQSLIALKRYLETIQK